MVYNNSSVSFCTGENSERTGTAKITAEETNGIRTTTILGREKEVR